MFSYIDKLIKQKQGSENENHVTKLLVLEFGTMDFIWRTFMVFILLHLTFFKGNTM